MICSLNKHFINFEREYDGVSGT